MSNVVWINFASGWTPARDPKGAEFMSGRDAFDGDIERLFSRPPALDDGDLFAAGLERRMKRGSRMRTALLTAGGVAGGLLAVREALEAGLTQDLTRITEQSARSVDAVSSLGAWSQLVDAASAADISAMPSMPLFWFLSAVLVGLAALTAVKTIDAS